MHYERLKIQRKFTLRHTSAKKHRNLTSQSIISWRGFAFENVCFNHVDQIKKALGISGVNNIQSLWSKRADDTEGAQIDLIIDRADNVINLCEVNFLTMYL